MRRSLSISARYFYISFGDRNVAIRITLPTRSQIQILTCSFPLKLPSQKQHKRQCNIDFCQHNRRLSDFLHHTDNAGQ